MKKTILTLALVGVAAVAFGQGRISIENDLHLVQFSTDASQLLAADASFAGKSVPTPNDTGGLVPSGKTIVFGLYAGSTAGSLSLMTTLPLSLDDTSLADGTIGSTGFVLPSGLPGGVACFMQVAAWDGAFANEALALAGGSYGGISSVFTMTPAGTGSPNPPPSSIQGGSSTWSGPVILTAVVPEPSTFALAGLGAAALLIFRRRK